MDVSKDLVQHIAVFGESGSGKTVLLSSFYGAAQEPQFLKKSLFHVVADDIGQGTKLHKNYLGMKDSARVPPANHFSATSYAFSLKLKEGNPRPSHAKPFDGLRLIWHDYPGEWFEQDVSGPEEAQRRVETFRSLLISDVALLLVDGQRLLDNAGQEEAYLKSLFTSFKNGLLLLKDELLTDGKPLVEFPGYGSSLCRRPISCLTWTCTSFGISLSARRATSWLCSAMCSLGWSQPAAHWLWARTSYFFRRLSSVRTRSR
ncbi:TRAFAC clade GTPase domain-containing protein [Raineyella sp.]|uniref:TRAFAC clade GTPase domain-containing protein n=1 Tax=Raineyella sp. TaxID=1911550 RepID=UPI002B215B32|nr:hypothetical protein [Raineyella sp.]MEA5153527.1 hypothetical protein [Raineyella sp.]